MACQGIEAWSIFSYILLTSVWSSHLPSAPEQVTEETELLLQYLKGDSGTWPQVQDIDKLVTMALLAQSFVWNCSVLLPFPSSLTPPSLPTSSSSRLLRQLLQRASYG